MATSVTFVSWNVQKFGFKKMSPEFIEYVTSVIKYTGASIVGIMELVGWQGDTIGAKLLASLGNKWQGVASEVTPAKPNEQYMFLWNTTTINVKAGERPWLYGIVGELDFEPAWNLMGITQSADQESFYQALIKDGYMDTGFEINPVNTQSVVAKPSSFTLTGFKTIPLAAKNAIAEVFKNAASVQFPRGGMRSPYMLRFVYGGAAPFVTALYHAPGPGNNWKYCAVNNLAIVDPIRNNPCVVMGDFNVKASELNTTAPLYFVDPKSGNYEIYVDSFGNKLYPMVFHPLVGPNMPAAPYPFMSLITPMTGVSNTSLVGGPVTDPTGKVTFNELEAVRSSPYDRIFYSSGAKQTRWGIYPAIGQIIDHAYTDAAVGSWYDKSIAKLATQIYVDWAKAHNVTPVTSTPPTKLSQAFEIYKQAISDHLPVYVVLTLP